MTPFIEHAKRYSAFHEKAVTRYAHMVGVPLLVLSLMILLGFVQIIIPGLLSVNVAEIITLIVLGCYFRLNWHLALPTTVLFIILLWISQFFSSDGPTSFALWSFLIIFLLGLGVQCVGHALEGKHPAIKDLLKNFWVAPLLLMGEVFFMFGWLSSLRDEIHGKKAKENGHNAKS